MVVAYERDTRVPSLAATHGANGRISVDSAPPGVQSSSYLQYLPAPLQGDPFLAQFLLIFESVLSPIERTIDNLADYFDPRLAPAAMLPWLASWVGLELDENWPIARQRQLILWTATLYRWRGTRRGLRQHLRLYTGHTPLIVENFDGMRLGQDASLGVTTRMGGSDAARPHCISITVLSDRPQELDERILRQIVELEKPAHVGYTLEVRHARPHAEMETEHQL